MLVRSKGAVKLVIDTPLVGCMRGTSQQVDSPVINNFSFDCCPVETTFHSK